MAGNGKGERKGREERRGEGEEGRRREGAPIEMKAPNENPKYATVLNERSMAGC